MKLTSSSVLRSGGAYVAESSECGGEREEGEVCQQRVQVNATTAISGLMDDVPKEVYEAFVVASTECLQCVDESSVHMLDTEDAGCNSMLCKGCGESYESYWTCWSCCGECRCMGCEWNLGPGDYKVCDDCCVEGRRQLSDEMDMAEVNFNINVCMDDVSPLDPSSTSYADHTQILADFETELQACYANTEEFMASWSSLCADSGIDLSLMARRDSDGSSTIMFGSMGVDSENAVVTTSSSSDNSHRSTSHMIFYSAFGFVTLSAFAVIGTAVVVKMLNKRKEAEEEQAALWVAEISSSEHIATPPTGKHAQLSASSDSL